MKVDAARAKVRGVVVGSAARAKASAARTLASLSSKLSVGAVLACFALPLLPQFAAHFGIAPPLAPAVGTLPPVTPSIAMPDPGRVEVVKSRPLPTPEAVGLGTGPDAPSTLSERQVVLHAKRQAPALPPPAPPAAKEPPKAEPQAQQPASPSAWSDADIASALKACVQLLGPIAAEVEVMPAMKQDQCGTAAPVLLKRIGGGVNAVEVQPPAVLNCAMVARLATWVEGTLQPVAKDTLASSVKRLNSASGYVCRGRNGDTYGNGKLSEHAIANAIDIASFTLSDGRIVDVGKHWGPTRRDKDRPQPGTPAADAKQPPPAPAARNLLPKRGAAQAAPVPATPAAAKGMPAEPEAQFLRRLHQGACGVFGTVLGPEANEAHREHFHFDLHPRKQSAFCQ